MYIGYTTTCCHFPLCHSVFITSDTACSSGSILWSEGGSNDQVHFNPEGILRPKPNYTRVYIGLVEIIRGNKMTVADGGWGDSGSYIGQENYHLL